MKKFLDRVGVAPKVLELIPQICQTCAACRGWAKPGPDNVCSAGFADEFNGQLECDLLLARKFIIFHMLDRCAHRRVAKLIEGKDEDALIAAVGVCGCRPMGPHANLFWADNAESRLPVKQTNILIVKEPRFIHEEKISMPDSLKDVMLLRGMQSAKLRASLEKKAWRVYLPPAWSQKEMLCSASTAANLTTPCAAESRGSFQALIKAILLTKLADQHQV
jgi:hypothetical protein